ncbi:MAG: 3-isopropylmalate dehydratase small subunit 1 [Chlamydiae bacterium]|nr:3-isopropylmalate dehydratase small subunit 1 [Chlamydiota bacterium]
MRKLHSQVVPLNISDIDTDVIIPAQFLTTTTKEGLGEHLFQRLKVSDPAFPLNLPKYQKAKIIVSGSNFGCGSSREHAAWALADYGFHAILAASFADIFYSNALKNQILPIILPEKIIQTIFDEEEKHDSYLVDIDLKDQSVLLPNGDVFIFDISPYRKECLLNEMDDLDYLRSKEEKIKAYFKKHPPKFSIDAIQTLDKDSSEL